MSGNMGVCETVVQLANLIQNSDSPISDVQRQGLEFLKAIPRYFEQRQIILWDGCLPAGLRDDTAELSRLITAVYDLACFNFYCGFEPAKTLKEYKKVASLFRQAGLSPPDVSEITDW
jgi:hypothetical protein